jgi:hypothetical protein
VTTGITIQTAVDIVRATVQGLAREQSAPVIAAIDGRSSRIRSTRAVRKPEVEAGEVRAGEHFRCLGHGGGWLYECAGTSHSFGRRAQLAYLRICGDSVHRLDTGRGVRRRRVQPAVAVIRGLSRTVSRAWSTRYSASGPRRRRPDQSEKSVKALVPACRLARPADGPLPLTPPAPAWIIGRVSSVLEPRGEVRWV